MKKLLIIFLLLGSTAWGETLFELVENNRVGKVEAELEAHPEYVNLKQHDVSLLHVAAFNGSQKMVDVLLRNGAELEARDMLGSTPLFRAFSNGHGELGLYLLSKGADLSQPNSSGETPFMVAARSVEVPVLKTLLTGRKVDLEQEDNRGRTALHHSIEQQRWENVKALLDAGADINHQDNKGQTLLHKSVNGGFPELARLLLTAGIDRDIKDQRGRTALRMARERNDREMIAILEPVEQAEKK